MTSPTEFEIPFSIIPIEGKGQGAIARRSLSQGELVLAESPLLVQDQRPSTESIKLALAQLPVAEQREYFSLTNCHRETMHPLRGIFHTNALPLGNSDPFTGEPAAQFGIFLKASRFNSSCIPNIQHEYDETWGKERLSALRDIAEGEELCVSYLDLFHPQAFRRAKLQLGFGFLCTCAGCSLEGESLRESDNRREEIRRLYDEIGLGGNPRENLSKVKRALTLLREEGLYQNWDSLHYDGFQDCVMVSDFQNAKAWVKRAYDIAVVASNPESEKVQKYQSFLKRPQSHLATGLRPRAKLSGPPVTE